MGIFGRTSIRESDIAGAFVVGILESAAAAWPAVADSLQRFIGDQAGELRADKWAAYHFGLAILATESQAIPNLLPLEQGARLSTWIQKYLDSPDLEGQGLAEFQEYCSEWAAAPADGNMPWDNVASALYDQLELKVTVKVGNSTFKDPLTLTILGEAVLTTGGAWWKNAITKFKIHP